MRSSFLEFTAVKFNIVANITYSITLYILYYMWWGEICMYFPGVGGILDIKSDYHYIRFISLQRNNDDIYWKVLALLRYSSPKWWILQVLEQANVCKKTGHRATQNSLKLLLCLVLRDLHCHISFSKSALVMWLFYSKKLFPESESFIIILSHYDIIIPNFLSGNGKKTICGLNAFLGILGGT